MTFRSEMGMYYSYYKTIVEAPSFLDGVNEITNNNLTEYPSVINALERFNLMPEIILGGSFRIFDRAFKALGIVGKQCWRVDRGQGLDPVDSCEGIQQPEYFYLEAVWFCAGITASVIFLYGVFLSDSVLGGIIAVMCFFFNHGECTRVQWTPPLRESFAYPFCLLQMLCVSVFIGHNQGTIDDTLPSARHKFQVVAVAITSCICLTLWQFSQFVLATQVIAFLMMFVCGFISRFSILLILTGQACAVAITLLIMFGNELLLSSLLTCLLLSSILTLFFFYPIIRVCDRFQVHKFLSVLVIALGTIVLKTRAFTSNHDAHILNILKSKFLSFRDFHTLLYTCSAEFDFLGRETVRKLTITWLLPAVLGIFLILFIRCCLIEDKISPIDSQIVYNALQFGAFAIMAVLIMRLKLFFTPHLCIIASLIASEKVEELLVWINNNTPSTAVFAGPMPVTAAILLSTRRPIVNHPHYEDALLRERTKKVYSAFSRKPPEEIYETLSSLYVNYLVLSDNWCFSHGR
ncbi:hypothetical protein AAG570_006270 [Ranatra chinensis]|uniref:Uncharacterized protein n=1 Tax=Ranatra chinensis TaxID=642074 RepID=A0ABD0YTG3_9HEMI